MDLKAEKHVDWMGPAAHHQTLPPCEPKRKSARWKEGVSHCLYILALTCLVWLMWSHSQPLFPETLDLPPQQQQPSSSPSTSDGLEFRRKDLIPLDFEVPPYYPISGSVGIAENLNWCHYDWNATGTLKLARGDPEQGRNFFVGVDVAASSQMALDSVVWPVDEDGRSIYIRCVDFPGVGPADVWDAEVRVDVTVFVKPYTLQFEHFRVRTDVLGIEIAQDLEFETYHMELFSDSGDIVGAESLWFTAHELSIQTFNGSITGNWSLPSRIEMKKWRSPQWPTAEKPIDINLIPKRWGAGPASRGALEAVSEAGDIHIRMPFASETLSLRNMSVDVHAEGGDISGSFVIGSWTSITTKDKGSIDVELLPYFSLTENMDIATYTADGDTNLTVLPPAMDSYYRINPLVNSRSEHTTTSGGIYLHYPSQWKGTALGVTETGNVSVAGDSFTTIVEREHLVVGRVGEEITSRLYFDTETGDGVLIVE